MHSAHTCCNPDSPLQFLNLRKINRKGLHLVSTLKVKVDQIQYTIPTHLRIVYLLIEIKKCLFCPQEIQEEEPQASIDIMEAKVDCTEEAESGERKEVEASEEREKVEEIIIEGDVNIAHFEENNLRDVHENVEDVDDDGEEVEDDGEKTEDDGEEVEDDGEEVEDVGEETEEDDIEPVILEHGEPGIDEVMWIKNLT